MQIKPVGLRVGKFCNYFFVMSAVFLVGCCIQFSNRDTSFPTDKRFTNKILNSVVAFPEFDESGNFSHMGCTGVFISKKHIVTARHCILDMQKYIALRTMFGDSDVKIADIILDGLARKDVSELGTKTFSTINGYVKNVNSGKKMNRKSFPETKLVYMNTMDLVVPHEKNDIAILEVIEPKQYSKYWLPISKIDPLINEEIMAVGMPMNDPWLVSRGIVSKFYYFKDTKTNKLKSAIIVGNITILPGFSGGPLVNRKGEIVGITSALKVSGDDNQMVDFGEFVSCYVLSLYYDSIL